MPATLSPEEVKALMSAIQDGKVATEGARGHRGPVANYDLTSQDRIIRGQMPTLDAINEQIAQQLALGLTGRTRLAIRASSAAATLLKFADLTPLLAPPAAVCVLGLGGGYGFGLAVLEPGVAEQLLAAALGDRRSRQPDAVPDARRELTAVEQGVLKRLLGVFTDAIASAWEQVMPFKPEPLRFELDPRMASIAPPSDVGIVSAFELTGGLDGRLQLVIPYAAVEPAKQRLAAPRRLSQRGDDRVARMMAREIEQVKVDVRGLLGATRITLSRLLELEQGEVLLLDRDECAPLPISVQGRLKLLGSPSVAGGAMAMKVERALAAPSPAALLSR
ncbi:flagellar motor switch protein FliM [Anaeromyxobacter diazotrophicus]|uniref:Flagellar motor switch protein FliM n=1 Tax=Anaeromyxobacter diazotrophicus TaxID=2590199 RepID=A0A7I9VSY4_9BACT|nr:FliM/FliN family flagellar motor switch protein [Anaeromyxobacter diazotrophicus]GEJ59199.1 flagellar motor switch protein FliM [Anaeromyxobacter diazotrophicus]